MEKRKKTGGRKTGSLNKTTSEVKAALEKAFKKLGGVAALTRWGKGNPSEFYAIWVKMLPKDVAVTGKDGGPITVQVIKYE